MKLAVDIGNSSAKAALFDGERLVKRVRFGADFESQLAAMAKGVEIEACAFAAVGARSRQATDCLGKIAPRVLEVTGETPTPLVCDYLTPRTLGADRLAAAVGAASCQSGKPLLIVDAGTCVTYDFVSADGHYLGGNISPGLGMRLRVLHAQTAALPLVEAEGELPPAGHDTETAVRAGVIRGMEFEIKGYIRSFRQHHPDGSVFVTGGNGHRFAQGIDGVERNDALVEIGLNRILDHQTR